MHNFICNSNNVSTINTKISITEIVSKSCAINAYDWTACWKYATQNIISKIAIVCYKSESSIYSTNVQYVDL